MHWQQSCEQHINMMLIFALMSWRLHMPMQVVGVVEAANWRQLCAVVRLEQLGCTSLLPFTHLMPSQQAQVRSNSYTHHTPNAAVCSPRCCVWV